MEPDWYEDPLGRYDGRFFDGESWTARVSDGGVLGHDPDFVERKSSETTEAVPVAAAEPDVSDKVDLGAVDDAPAVTPLFDTSSAPLTSTGERLTVASPESPVRVVAVLPADVVSPSAAAGALDPDAETASELADTESARSGGPLRRWLVAAVLVAAAAVATMAMQASSNPARIANSPRRELMFVLAEVSLSILKIQLNWPYACVKLR